MRSTPGGRTRPAMPKRPCARRGVDQLGALALQTRELARQVVDLVGDVVHAGAALARKCRRACPRRGPRAARCGRPDAQRAASTPCSSCARGPPARPRTAARRSTIASSRSSTATARWWMPFVATPRCYLSASVPGSPGRPERARRCRRSRRRATRARCRRAARRSSSLFSVSCSSSASARRSRAARCFVDQADRLVERLIGQPGLLGVAQTLRLLGERVVVGPHRPRGDARRPCRTRRPSRARGRSPSRGRSRRRS